MKKEIAKRHADVLQNMPDSCWSGRKSFWSFLMSWMWTKNSECVRHFEAVEIDPLWEVPPTKVSDLIPFFCIFVVFFCLAHLSWFYPPRIFFSFSDPVWFIPFLPARRYASAGLCDSDVSGRPSVRLSHAGIVPSRAKAGSWNVHHLIAPSL